MISFPGYRDVYTVFMKDLVDKGYAERVSETEFSLDNGSVWNLPHHGVYHPRNTGRIRIV